ncbi:hypothetical protein [Alkalihalobacillus sp. BA299]|uniref:hypothetical protein n=1 Tax=Alkalihalobacillus sp. BA299 TaxID=2815938 RepID=UPI001ADC56FB|nr:hypothetical protein [Alkalihalobacillus sp. BA299]
MALMKKIHLKKDYVQVPNTTAQAVEKGEISLQALGLIVNLWSYNVEKWELHKTELYKRFGKNKKTSTMNAWDELVEANYIIEFKYRNGKHWEYEYFYRVEPFSEEEKEKLLAEAVDVLGVSSTSDFQKLKMRSSKWEAQNQHISNNQQTQNFNNEIKNKEKEHNLNQEDEKKHDKEENAFGNLLQELKLPMTVKKLIYDYNLQGYGNGNVPPINDSLKVIEIETFYNTNTYIDSTATAYDYNFINDVDFYTIVKSILENGPDKVDTTIGILRHYTFNKLYYKKQNQEYREAVSSPLSSISEEHWLARS